MRAGRRGSQNPPRTRARDKRHDSRGLKRRMAAKTDTSTNGKQALGAERAKATRDARNDTRARGKQAPATECACSTERSRREGAVSARTGERTVSARAPHAAFDSKARARSQSRAARSAQRRTARRRPHAHVGAGTRNFISMLPPSLPSRTEKAVATQVPRSKPLPAHS